MTNASKSVDRSTIASGGGGSGPAVHVIAGGAGGGLGFGYRDLVQEATQSGKIVHRHNYSSPDHVFSIGITPKQFRGFYPPMSKGQCSYSSLPAEPHGAFAHRFRHIFRINYGRLLNLLRRLAHRLLLPR